MESFFESLLTPFSDNDKKFIRGYWQILRKVLLNANIRMDEIELSDSVFYAQESRKLFYAPIVCQNIDREVNCNSNTYKLPRGAFDVVCYGDFLEYHKEMDLPVKIDDAVDVSCDRHDVVVDGCRVLGTGRALVSWKSSKIDNFSIENGIVNSSRIIRKIQYKQACGSENTKPVVVKSERLHKNKYRISDFTTKYLVVGQNVKINDFYYDKIKKIVHKHVIELYDIHGNSNDQYAYLEIDAFPYAYPLKYKKIQLREYRENVDYIISDGYICFAFPVRETLIAERAYIDDSVIIDRYFSFLKEKPENNFKVWWHDIFTGGYELFIHASLGLPFTTEEMGKQKCIGFEYTSELVRNNQKFYHVGNREIQGSFCESDNGIYDDHGAFYKIVDRLYNGNVIVDRIPASNEFSGSVGRYVFSSIIMQDDTGNIYYIAVPPNCFPCISKDQVIDPWSKLTTGVRILDATPEKMDVKKFGTGTDKKILEHNTFVIEIDVDGEIIDRLIRYLIPSWSEYHIKRRINVNRLYDRCSVYWDSVLLFGKILPSEYVIYSSNLNVQEYHENKVKIDPVIPYKIIGDFDGTYITNIRDANGNPLDISSFLFDKIRTYSNASNRFNVLETSLCSNLGDRIQIVYNAGIPIGNDQEFMFMEQTSLDVFDIPAREGGLVVSGGILPDREVGRTNQNKWYFDKYVSWSNNYLPAIFRLGDVVIHDEFYQEYGQVYGASLDGNKIIRTDFHRLGIRSGMMFFNSNEWKIVESFNSDGEAILNSNVNNGTLSDWGFCCFLAETSNGAIIKN